MRFLFWRRSPARSDASTESSTADSSAIAGVSPDLIAVEDRRASKYARLATISAWSVVAGIVLEDWDTFGMVFSHPFPYLVRAAAGGFIVALAIAGEIRFSALESKSERRIRDWYAIRVAELQLEAAQLRRDNCDTITLQRDRCLDDFVGLVEKLKQFSGTEYCFEIIGNGNPRDPEIQEARQFAAAIQSALKASEWGGKSQPMPMQGAYVRPCVHIIFVTTVRLSFCNFPLSRVWSVR